MFPAPTNTKVKITKIKSVLDGKITIYKIKAPPKYSPDSQTITN
jgi:hypothetical protein